MQRVTISSGDQGIVTHGFTRSSLDGVAIAFHYDCDECRRSIASSDDRQLAMPVCDDSPETPPGG